MYQDFQPIIGSKAYGVARGKYHGDCPIYRCIDNALFRDNAETVSQTSVAERGVTQVFLPDIFADCR